jgi:hypothetical protein
MGFNSGLKGLKTQTINVIQIFYNKMRGGQFNIFHKKTNRSYLHLTPV